MGTDPQYGAGPEQFSIKGPTTDCQEAGEETGGWELRIPLIGGGNGASRLQGDWDIRHEEE